MSTPNDRLRDFCADLFVHDGALVEAIEPHGLEAMLPEVTRERLQVPEYIRLGFAAELPPDAERVSLESEWLSRFAELLGERGRLACLHAWAELPPQPRLDRAIERRVALDNAVYRLQNVYAAWTRYGIWVVRYTALSDEKREGLITTAGNTANDVTLDPPSADALLAVVFGGREDFQGHVRESIELPARWSETKLRSWLSRSLGERIRTAEQPFIRGMQRRLDRDLARIHGYYTGLRDESQRRLSKASTDGARERLRIQAGEREYRSKVADLRQKFALRVTSRLAWAVELVTPVWRVEVLIKRRKRQRTQFLDWCPMTGQLDPLPCEWGHFRRDNRMVCDDALHLVPAHAMAPCSKCGRAYCRACRPRSCAGCGSASADNWRG